MSLHTIITGDCVQAMQTYIDDGEIQTCVTSPPYFGLRDYGADGQIGLEPTPDEYVAKLVEVFREVKRCLAKDGTLWLNLGDSYAGSGRGIWNIPDEEKKRKGVKESYRPSVKPTAGFHAAVAERAIDRKWVKPPVGYKQKDLIGIPWMVAFALRADGWYLRQDIIWAKPNPMPHPNTDRCVSSHEHIFLLSKSKKYYFDHKAIREPAVGGNASNGFVRPERVKFGETGDDTPYVAAEDGLRNARDVWMINVRPFKEAHFATFPPEIPTRCIKAGSRIGDLVLDPFGGAGTTAVAATALGRRSILCELNPDYVEIAEVRLAQS